jgi:RNA polymerase sigma-70 factor (ECF subfamily)
VASTSDAAALAILVENHARFLSFLERRVGSTDIAEDLLQDAFVRGIERAASLHGDESVIAWFYRVLRNSLIDHYRRQGAEQRALATVAGEAAEVYEPDEELFGDVCECVIPLLDTIRTDYADALRQVDLEGGSVSGYAERAGITANNASVRLHRARRALQRQLVRCCGVCMDHACLDCTCKGPTKLLESAARRV